MASRTYVNLGVLMAGVFGVFTAYSAFQPELQREQEEKAGGFQQKHVETKDNVISEAILSDLRDAKEQVAGTKNQGSGKGALWGVREAIFGSGKTADTKVPAQQALTAAPIQKTDAAVVMSKAEAESKKG
ncbi:hypothetical protein LTR78_004989 [Recurvomyces mirabilis]|uniref:Uncharacterized protein n=1 Tax=Recurvomyces mirabilis TaxID=574656 RepID=A0AAE0WNH0_9PEZI|nr:hypothetical protein LTR78_004989 [Recurvomyces mirabilis]KAK5158395.1 hypothetical protein LTS14_003413 [Recurvomyces mirabilis]